MTDPLEPTQEIPRVTLLTASDLISDEHHSRVAAEYAALVRGGEEPGVATLSKAKATVRGKMLEEKKLLESTT